MTRSISQPGFEHIPTHVAQRLRQLVRRAKGVALAKGSACTVGTFVVGTLLSAGAGLLLKLFSPDAFTDTVRLAMAGTVVLATLLVAVFTLIRPLRHHYSLAAAARAFENDHPELQERISTTVELMLSQDPDQYRGSRQMIDAVAAAADQDSTHVSPKQVIQATRARRTWLVAALLAAGTVALAANWPDHFRQLWDDRVQWTTVESLSGDQPVVSMEPVTLRARSTSKLRSIDSGMIVIDYLDGTASESWPVKAVEKDANTSTFRYTVSQVARPFRYYFRVHDGRSPTGRVTVMERPQVVSVQVSCQFPTYTGEKEPAPLRENNGKFTALRHSTLTLRVDVNCDLVQGRSVLVFQPEQDNLSKSSDPRLAATRSPDEVGTKGSASADAHPRAAADAPQAVAIPLTPIASRQYQALLPVTANGRCHFELYGGGLQSRASEWAKEIVVEEASKPTVEIEKPEAGAKVVMRPDDHLPIVYQAQDRFALGGLGIWYHVNNGPWSRIPATMPDDAVRRVRTTVNFDLRPLSIEPGLGTIEYYLEVTNSLPKEYGGPLAGASDKRSIKLEMSVKDYAVQRAEVLRADFADAIAQIVKELKAAQSDVRSVQNNMRTEPTLDEAQEGLTGTAIKHLALANDLALAEARKVDSTEYEKMGERLKGIAEGHIQPARDMTAATLDLADQSAPRLAKLTQADQHIQRAIDLLTAVGREFQDLIKLEEGTQKLAKMSKEQDDIANALAEEFRDPADLAKLTKEEMDLLEKSRQLLNENKEAAAKPLFDIATAAEKTLNEKIREVIDAQKDLAKETQQAQDLTDLDKKAKELARRQDELAKQTGNFESAHADPLAKADAPKDIDKPMAAAAQALDKKDLTAAMDKQDRATTQIDRAEQQTRKRTEALTTQADTRQSAEDKRLAPIEKQLADKARQLEQQQKELIPQTAQAKAKVDQATTKSDEARSQADAKLADLAKKQQDIARKSEQLEKDAAAKLDAKDAPSAKANDPTPPAKQAADQLDKKSPAQAAAPAQQAEQKARQLADAMDQAAKKHEQSATQAQEQAKSAAAPAEKQAAQAKADQEKKQADAAHDLADQAKKLADAQAEVNKQLPSAKQAADQATGESAKKDQAKQEMADAAKKQQAVATEAAALENKLKAGAEPMRKLAAEHDPAKPAAEAAAKVPTDPQAAAKPQQEAAKQLGEVAKGLDEMAKQAEEHAAKADQAQKQLQAARQANSQAAALKAKQEQLNEETKKLAADYQKAQEDLSKRQLADLLDKQKAVADRAADLADAVAKQPKDDKGNEQPPQPNATADQAAADAKAAAEEMDDNKLPQANEKGKHAEGQLADLAGQLAKEAGKQAGVDPQRQQQKAAQAAEAGKLAGEQKQVNEQVANLMKKDPLDNLPLKQEALREQTKELGEQAKMVADFMKQLAPQIGQIAQEAAQQLADKAPAAQAQAAQAMKNNQMAQAKAAEQQAVAAAEKADELFQKAAQQAAATAEPGPQGDKAAEKPEPGDPAGKNDPPDPYDPLAKAAWAEQQAQAAMKDAAAAQAAKQALEAKTDQAQAAAAAKEAARQLGQASKEMGQMVVSMSSQPSDKANQPAQNYTPPWFSTTGTAGKPPDMRKLNFELGVTTSEWNRLPGYLQQAILQSADEQIPQEYRELVKRYFQTISQEAGQK